MGFELERRYVLEFEGTAMYGARIVLRGTSVGVGLKLGDMLPTEEWATLLCQHVIEWNLEVGGEPVKPTPEDVLAKVEKVYLDLIATEWRKAAAGITAPLARPSTDGELQDLPMDDIPPS